MIDLHIHSKRSDGSYSLEAIVMKYISMGYQYIGITDHDRLIDQEEIKKAYSGSNLTIIPGVEISAYDYESDRKVHLLGYFIKDKAALKELLGKVTVSRREVARKIIERLQEDGYDITYSEVMKYTGTGGVYKQHILHCLREKGYGSEITEEDFKKGERYYFPIEYADYRVAVRTIKKSGGIAVLAHPGESKIYDLISKLKEEGLDGIQIKHPNHEDVDMQECSEIANKYDLVKFTGSDYHGKYSEKSIEYDRLKLSKEDEKALIEFLKTKLN